MPILVWRRNLIKSWYFFRCFGPFCWYHWDSDEHHISLELQEMRILSSFYWYLLRLGVQHNTVGWTTSILQQLRVEDPNFIPNISGSTSRWIFMMTNSSGSLIPGHNLTREIQTRQILPFIMSYIEWETTLKLLVAALDTLVMHLSSPC